MAIRQGFINGAGSQIVWGCRANTKTRGRHHFYSNGGFVRQPLIHIACSAWVSEYCPTKSICRSPMPGWAFKPSPAQGPFSHPHPMPHIITHGPECPARAAGILVLHGGDRTLLPPVHRGRQVGGVLVHEAQPLAGKSAGRAVHIAKRVSTDGSDTGGMLQVKGNPP